MYYRGKMSRQSKWSERAEEYKTQGEMYCRVEFDNNGEPVKVSVAQDQVRKGDFRIEEGTAIYVPHNILTLPEAVQETVDYVKSLSFVDSVIMQEKTKQVKNNVRN